MPETFTVTVETEDGKCLIREKITGNYFSLYSQLSVLFRRFFLVLKDIQKSEIEPGSGTPLSAGRFSSPTEF